MKLVLSFLTLISITSLIGQADLKEGIYAKFTTTKGEIICELEYKKTPMTVANFVGLAEGNFKMNDKLFNKPYYDGLTFHRVIKDFMIQGGCPLGNGSGDPGYKFYDEIVADLKHDKPGILSMANSGPATNGSQFFITHKATPWLDGKHTVFGHVVSGQNVVDAVEQGDKMENVTIIRIGTDALNWSATNEFEKVYRPIKAEDDKKNEAFAKISAMTEDEYKEFMFQEVKKLYRKAKLSKSGLVYVIEKKGKKTKATKGAKLSVHYIGTFRADGKKFDSSRDRNQPMDFTFQEQRMIPGFEEGIGLLGKGGKAKLFIPYFQAYGKNGRPGAIPPYSDLVFDIEIMNLTPPSEAPKDDHNHDGHNHDGHDHDGHKH
jgi:peptidyl-prolyl cis-trans isomerase A (cyclophilin A)